MGFAVILTLTSFPGESLVTSLAGFAVISTLTSFSGKSATMSLPGFAGILTLTLEDPSTLLHIFPHLCRVPLVSSSFRASSETVKSAGLTCVVSLAGFALDPLPLLSHLQSSQHKMLLNFQNYLEIACSYSLPSVTFIVSSLLA